tara:strand:+ start:2664 stop:3089 length:426 start_codon:yes stop_codon:yes gene_type:complete
MADLSSLIRLHKHELDEKQREIGRLYEGYNQLSLQRDQLRQRREEEVLAAQESPDTVTFTLSGFLEKSKAQEEKLNAQIFTLQEKIETLRDDMLESFAELKKYELTQAERQRVLAEEQKIKESKMFDDIAISGFRRQEDDG